jgi:hypothetical protein
MVRTCTGTVFKLATPKVAGMGGIEAMAAWADGAALPVALLSEHDDIKIIPAAARPATAIRSLRLKFMPHPNLCLSLMIIPHSRLKCLAT